MKYKGKDNWAFGDMWGLVVDGVFHGIHIKWSKVETPLGHVCSKDLLHYTACEDVLYPLPENEYPQDCLMKYTGCCITGKDGRNYIYYTMRNSNTDEKIALAISDDMKTFNLYDKNPVLEVDENIFSKGTKTNCRDMIVVYLEDKDIYYGYFAAMADVGYGVPVGVIGVAVSKDLISWSNQKIVYIPPFIGVIEVPDVFCIDGKWYLTMLTGNNYGAKGISEDEDVSSFTCYAVADSPDGPFVHTDDRIFIGGNTSSGAVCRTVVFDGKRYVIYVDRGKEGHSISLPKEVKVKDGKLRPCYAPITQKIRTGEKIDRFDDNAIEYLRGSFAWETISGKAKTSDDGKKIILDTKRNSYQKFRLENIKYPSVELECTLTGNCSECGFMLEAYSADKADNPKETSFVSLNFIQKKIIVYHGAFEYVPYSKRSCDLERNKDYHVRLFVIEGVFEIFVDDILVLQGPMETADHIVPGFMLGNGDCEIKNLKIFALEK